MTIVSTIFDVLGAAASAAHDKVAAFVDGLAASILRAKAFFDIKKHLGRNPEFIQGMKSVELLSDSLGIGGELMSLAELLTAC